MDQGFMTVIGMSIAYVASLVGMLLAAWRWKQNQQANSEE